MIYGSDYLARPEYLSEITDGKKDELWYLARRERLFIILDKKKIEFFKTSVMRKKLRNLKYTRK